MFCIVVSLSSSSNSMKLSHITSTLDEVADSDDMVGDCGVIKEFPEMVGMVSSDFNVERVRDNPEEKGTCKEACEEADPPDEASEGNDDRLDEQG